MDEIVVAVNPKDSYIRGVNGDFELTALKLWDYEDRIYLDGIGKRGRTIKGGIRVDKQSFAELCRKFLKAYPAEPVSSGDQYLARGGTGCPVCGENGEAEGVSSVDVESSYATQKCECLNCSATWTDIYHLKEIDHVETPKCS